MGVKACLAKTKNPSYGQIALAAQQVLIHKQARASTHADLALKWTP